MRDISFIDRLELKFIVDIRLKYILLKELKNYTFFDSHGENGFYKIKSLYYDPVTPKPFLKKMMGEQYAEKLRIRAYNDVHPEDDAFMEIKRRRDGRNEKIRIKIPLQKAYEAMAKGSRQTGEDFDFSEDDRRIYYEMQYFRDLFDIGPKLIISYDRVALFGAFEKDLRITFDSNIRCRSHDLRLESKVGELYLIPPQYSIMEVKIDEAVPPWFLEILVKYNLASESISKYLLSLKRLNIV